jgi:[ribosomal protein S5]-alanine N-acetyltransferase
VAFLPAVGRGVLIDRLVPGDAPALSRSHSDPDNARYQGWRSPLSQADALRFIEAQPAVDALAPGTGVQLALRETVDGPLVGDLYVHRPGATPGEVEVGITLVPGFHGRGLATAAVTALVHALRTQSIAPPPVRRVVAIVDVENQPSRVLFERLGFRVERRIEASDRRRDGTMADEVVFGLALEPEAGTTRLGEPATGS